MEQIRLALAEGRFAPPVACAGRSGAEETRRRAAAETPACRYRLPLAAAARKIGLEERLGAHWAVIVGGIALAFGALLLVKYSIEQGFFGPGLRVVGGLLLGFGLVAAGEYLRRKEKPARISRKPRRSLRC